MEKLYVSRDKSGDITFIVETERIRAHRWVLASASQKYQTQFYGLRPDEGEIHVPNVLASAFKEFLQFFYKDYISLTVENIESVLDLAKQTLVDAFIDTCVDFIKIKIIPNNVCKAYSLAILYDLKTLRISCEENITAATKNVFVSDGFLQCDREMLLQILKLNSFNCTESHVFNACIEWARKVCKQNQLNEEDTTNLRNMLGDAIYEIRFASMNVNEFADLHHKLTGFFTGDESLEIIYLIGQVKNNKTQVFNPTPRQQYIHPKPSASHVHHQKVKRMNSDNERSRFNIRPEDFVVLNSDEE